MSTSFFQTSAAELLNGLSQARWTSAELTQHFLERIAQYNPHYHPIHTLNPRALAEAQASDASRKQGQTLGPLAGLPMTLKDAFACQGLRSTYGLQLYRFYRPRWESRVVSALRKAGAIILGRSAVPTSSFDWNCKNQVFPECRNPHHPDYSPGGSSGGPAAALVLGLTPLELGSDMGGSIRYPAHCCGVYALRTSDGWLSMRDMGPDPQKGMHNLVTCGPMARNLSDLSLMLDILGAAFPDRRSKPLPTERRPLRIAYTSALPDWPVDQDTQQLLKQWLDARRAEGHQVFEANPLEKTPALHPAWATIGGYEMGHCMPPLPGRIKQFLLDHMLVQKLGPGWFGPAFLAGMGASKSDYLQALAQLRSLQNQVDRFFEDVDAWVLPASPTPARRLTESGQMLETEWGPLPYSDLIASYHCATTMMGTPVLSLPVGQGQSGLPIGIQVHGPRFGDQRLLAQFQAFDLPDTPVLSPAV